MFKSDRNLLVLFSMVFLFVLPIPQLMAQQSTGDSMLRQGDTIQVYVDVEDFEKLKSKEQGSQAMIKVLNKEDRFGETIISKFALVYCTVTDRSKGGMYGGSGKMILSIDSTHSTAGTMIPLRGSAYFEGKGKKTMAYILFPVGWLIKGSDIQFPEGENSFKAAVVKDTPVNYLR